MTHGNEIKRISFLLIMALLFWVILILRMAQLQLIDRGEYVEKAKSQYTMETKLASNRGNIYDRNADYLAINRPALSVGVDVSKIKDPNYAAGKFAEILGGNQSYYLRQLINGNHFIWLRRGLEDEIAPQFDSLKIEGVRIVNEMRRYYPHTRLAANLVGFTDVDLNGLSGIELTQDKVLRGSPGRAFHQKDALGKTFAGMSQSIQKPESGKNIITTIDNTYQLFAEEELKYAINENNADGGIVIVTNPNTGEILAMAVAPSFDPNEAGNFPPGSWRNRSITDSFEPGSTFKPIFMSAILEEDVKSPEDIIFCENGNYKIYDREIEDVSGYGWLTLRKIITNSSNIGMTKLAQEINPDVIYQYARDFGFGVKTGIELSGEVSGDLKNSIEWSRSTPIALAMGYEVSATALQMAMAYGTIANGGKLLKPKIYLDEFADNHSNGIVNKPKVIRQVISEETSKILCSMMEQVVDEGTGSHAAIPGLRVAGKTGTARKYDVKKQGYSTEEFVSSFIGFFPADNPQILITVIIDNPKKEYFGGIVSAPTFKRIAQRIYRTLEIDTGERIKKSTIENSQNLEIKIVMPDLTTKTIEVGAKILNGLGLDYHVENTGEIIAEQNPAPGTKVEQTSLVRLKLKELKLGNGKYTNVPKVVGLTIREALNKLTYENINVIVQGSGRVVKQNPLAGERIRIGARCVIECEPTINLSEFRSW